MLFRSKQDFQCQLLFWLAAKTIWRGISYLQLSQALLLLFIIQVVETLMYSFNVHFWLYSLIIIFITTHKMFVWFFLFGIVKKHQIGLSIKLNLYWSGFEKAFIAKRHVILVWIFFPKIGMLPRNAFANKMYTLNWFVPIESGSVCWPEQFLFVSFHTLGPVAQVRCLFTPDPHIVQAAQLSMPSVSCNKPTQFFFVKRCSGQEAQTTGSPNSCFEDTQSHSCCIKWGRLFHFPGGLARCEGKHLPPFNVLPPPGQMTAWKDLYLFANSRLRSRDLCASLDICWDLWGFGVMWGGCTIEGRFLEKQPKATEITASTGSICQKYVCTCFIVKMRINFGSFGL